jgi:hypothetical protein
MSLTRPIAAPGGRRLTMPAATPEAQAGSLLGDHNAISRQARSRLRSTVPVLDNPVAGSQGFGRRLPTGSSSFGGR